MRGERPRPLRARALAVPSSRGRSRLPASPPPSRGFRRARAFTLTPPPWQRRAPPTALALARALGEEGGARDSASSLPHACGRGGPSAATPSGIFSAGRGRQRQRLVAGFFPLCHSGVWLPHSSWGPVVGLGASQTTGRRAAPSPIPEGRK